MVDEEHAPLHWFPRTVPRVSVWATNPLQQRVLTDRFGTEAKRICAAEQHHLDDIRTTRIYRYVFDASQFRADDLGEGRYVTSVAVYPERVEPIDDLIGAHCSAGVELRLTPRLGALMDAIVSSGLPFSFVRIRDAQR